MIDPFYGGIKKSSLKWHQLKKLSVGVIFFSTANNKEVNRVLSPKSIWKFLTMSYPFCKVGMVLLWKTSHQKSSINGHVLEQNNENAARLPRYAIYHAIVVLQKTKCLPRLKFWKMRTKNLLPSQYGTENVKIWNKQIQWIWEQPHI